MSANDYVKFVTQQVVRYMDQPKEVRTETKKLKKLEKEPFLTKWFGMLPLSVMMMVKNKKEK